MTQHFFTKLLMTFRGRLTLFLLIIILAILFFMWSGRSTLDETDAPLRLSIAGQFGLAYAPLQVMQYTDILEKELPPDTEIVWSYLSNTASIREAMVAGEVDMGFMAIPPFLIGLQNGMDWRIATGLCESPTGLVTSDINLQTIKDIKPTDRIALPQPGSIQHILLAMAADKAFGEPGRFDQNLIALSHPDGFQAMLAGNDIHLHFTTPPYLDKELAQPGYTQILSGEEILGEPFSFIVGACDVSFKQKQPALYQGFLNALQKTILWMEENPRQAEELLASIYDISPDEVRNQLQQLQFETIVRGVQPLYQFMLKANFLDAGKQNSSSVKPDSLYFEGVINE